MQVRLADVVKVAIDTAFYQSKMGLCRVYVGVASKTDVFACGMVDGMVSRKSLAERRIYRTLISHQRTLWTGVLFKDGTKRLGRHVGDVKATGFTVALDQ